ARRLRAEGPEHVDEARLESARRPPVHDERADDFVLREQRHGEQGTIAGREDGVADAAAIDTRIADVRNLYGLARLGGAPDGALAIHGWCRSQRREQNAVEGVACAGDRA